MSRYLEGISLAALARGNRRMLAPFKARHADVKDQHAEILAAWKERRVKAREIKDPEQRAKALEELKGERPTHPILVAAGCTVVAGIVLWPMVHGHAGVLAAGGLTLWVIVALIIGQTDPNAETAAGDASEDDDDQAEEEPGQPPAPTVPTPADARRAVAVLGAAGTHVALTAVTAHLAAAHPLWKRSGKAVRALLQEARVEVRGGVRVEGVSVPGIHHDDVPPLPSPSESTPDRVVVAGQSNNNNANNTEEWSTREGFVWRVDPDHPAHTIVARPADAA